MTRANIRKDRTMQSTFGNMPQPVIRGWAAMLALVVAGWWMIAPIEAVAEINGKISKEQASQSALQAVPGQVTDVTIERKLGKTVYVIEVIADKGGDETDVLVDMDSGKVLGIER
jgi:uncharacterized membrane protein YkoI